jgi:hypothetical protein
VNAASATSTAFITVPEQQHNKQKQARVKRSEHAPRTPHVRGSPSAISEKNESLKRKVLRYINKHTHSYTCKSQKQKQQQKNTLSTSPVHFAF